MIDEPIIEPTEGKTIESKKPKAKKPPLDMGALLNVIKSIGQVSVATADSDIKKALTAEGYEPNDEADTVIATLADCDSFPKANHIVVIGTPESIEGFSLLRIRDGFSVFVKS